MEERTHVFCQCAEQFHSCIAPKRAKIYRHKWRRVEYTYTLLDSINCILKVRIISVLLNCFLKLIVHRFLNLLFQVSILVLQFVFIVHVSNLMHIVAVFSFILNTTGKRNFQTLTREILLLLKNSRQFQVVIRGATCSKFYWLASQRRRLNDVNTYTCTS